MNIKSCSFELNEVANRKLNMILTVQKLYVHNIYNYGKYFQLINFKKQLENIFLLMTKLRVN